jgi:predicted alpha/beta hydrolase family esterase
MSLATAAVKSLNPDMPLYLIGQSLGTGVACELAATCHLPALKGILLLTPYTTMTDMAQHMVPIIGPLLLRDRYDCVHNLEKLTQDHNPPRIVVVAGRHDQMIPSSHAGRVATAGNGLLLYYNGGHSDVYLTSQSWVPIVKQYFEI